MPELTCGVRPAPTPRPRLSAEPSQERPSVPDGESALTSPRAYPLPLLHPSERSHVWQSRMVASATKCLGERAGLRQRPKSDVPAVDTELKVTMILA